MANNKKENKIEKFTKEAIGKTLNQFNKEIGVADLVEVNKNQDRILNGILSQVNDESTEKTEKSNIITLDNSTDGVVELKEIQGDTNVNVSKIEEMPITHDIGEKEGNIFNLNEVTQGAINIGEIEGNTLVNCNKDDKKELVLMKDLSAQGDNNITITEGVDGGLVDVALEGNTLVNVSKTKDSTAISKAYTVENSGNHIALQGDIDGSCRPVITGKTLVNLVEKINHNAINIYNIFLSYAKENCDYTIMFNANFEAGNTTEIGWIIDRKWTNKLPNNSVINGFNKLKITNTDGSNNLRIKLTNQNEITISNFILLEGDYTDKPIPDYFEGLQSSFEDNLVTQEMVDSGEEIADNLGKYRVDYKVTGKNKFNKDNTIANRIIDVNDGSIKTENKAEPQWYTSSIIDISNKSNITISHKNDSYANTSSNIRYLLMDENYNPKLYKICKCANYAQTVDVTQYKYMRISVFIIDFPLDTIQLEEGDTATSYEPYKEYTKTLYLNSPLLEGDTIEEKDGGIYHVHRYGKVILDGSEDENWRLYNNDWQNDEIISFGTDFLNAKSWSWEEFPTSSTLIDKIPVYENGYCHNNNILGFTSDDSIRDKNKIIRVPRLYLTTEDLAGFEVWLSENPITVVYELASPTYELIEQSNLVIPSYANGHLDFNTVIPVERVEFKSFEEELTYLYPATSYTLQFVSDKATTADVNLGGTELLAQSIVKGLNRISITTPETLLDNKLVINGVGANISEVVVTDTDREFKYFEGMKSVGECEGNIEISSNNKNLNKFPTVLGYIYSDTGLDKQASNRFRIDGYVENLIEGETYKISCTRDNGETCVSLPSLIVFLDKDKQVIGNILNKSSITIPIGCKYIKVASESSTPDINSTFIQITRDVDDFTQYTPNEFYTQQLTHEPLRAVGKVKDRYVMIDGKWYIERNCSSITFNDVTDKGQHTPNEQIFWYNFPIDNIFSKNEMSEVICDTLICDITNSHLREYAGTIGGVNNSIRIVSQYNQEDFRQWIQQNPVTVVYQLKTPVYEKINYNPLEVYSDVTHITTNSTIPCNVIVKNHGYNCLLKPNTTYTVASNLGLNTVTTGVDIGDSCLRFYNEDTSNVTTMKDVLVLEGDWTSKPDLIPANFSGIESAFEQEYDTEKGKYKVNAKVVGKNLFDGKFKQGYISGKTGLLIKSNDSYSSVNFINVKNINKITISYTSIDARPTIGVARYDENYNFINFFQSNVLSQYEETVDVSNCHYIKFRLYQKVTDISKIISCQLEQGDTATEYEPYKENNITFYLNEPLRGTGVAKDRIYIKDDKVIVQRNCSTLVLDGRESWIYMNNFPSKIYAVPFTSNIIENSSIMCDKIIPRIYSISAKNYWAIFYSANRLRIQTPISTVDEFKQWLQQNPVTVVYQLAEPTYEEVEYSSNRLILNTFNNESFNNSTLSLDTNISPKLLFKPLYEELVYVKSNTKHYIQFNAVGSGEVIVNLGGTESTTEIVEGYNCIPITTPSESTNLMTISGQGITISEVVVSEVVCGGYYKGLQSCFEEHMENGKYRILLRGIALDGSKVNGIKLYIDEPLRGIKDTKDRLCIKDGKLMVERKYGSVILDGSDDEMYTEDNVNLSGRNNYSAYYSNENIGTGGSYRDPNKLLCDKMSTYAYDYVTGNFGDETGVASISGRILISVQKTKLATIDLDGFRNYLNTSPMTFIYQLATPTYEEATNEYGLPIVFEGYENGIVYIDSAVTPTTHIKYTSNNQLATTLSKAEEQNITTQEDINMNVVTYMMDIDMILTEMEMSNDTSVMAVRRDSSNENMLDRMSEEDKKVYRDNTVVMLEKMITANVLEKEDIEGRINMYYNKNRISKEQYEYLKSLL